MNKEFMADVMNELDDDLVHEAAELRSGKNARRRSWIIPAAMAASAAIIAGVLIGSYGFPLLAQNNETLVPELSDQATLQEENAIQDVQEVPSLIISVRYWSEDGFSGTVTDTVDTKAIPAGSKVFVKTDSNTEFINMEELEDFRNMTVLTDTNKEDSMQLHIMFDLVDIANSATDQSDSEKVYYLYAEQVWPAECETEMGE